MLHVIEQPCTTLARDTKTGRIVSVTSRIETPTGDIVWEIEYESDDLDTIIGARSSDQLTFITEPKED